MANPSLGWHWLTYLALTETLLRGPYNTLHFYRRGSWGTEAWLSVQSYKCNPRHQVHVLPGIPFFAPCDLFSLPGAKIILSPLPTMLPSWCALNHSHCSLSCYLASFLLRSLPCATVTSSVCFHCCGYNATHRSPIGVFAILHRLLEVKSRSFSFWWFTFEQIWKYPALEVDFKNDLGEEPMDV